MKDDFYRGLYKVTEEIATQAAIEHRADTQAKHPNAARICRLANAAMKQACPMSEKKWQDVPVYAVYLGGCCGVHENITIGSRFSRIYKIPANINIESIQDKILDREWKELQDYFGQYARFEIYFDPNQAMKRSAEVWGN
jgi:hypothetical protein